MFRAESGSTNRSRHAMVGAFAVLAMVLTLGKSSRAQELAPFTAWANQVSVAVRSGPSEEFYETERLTVDTPVEVYREVDGWYAIRPTDDSFSWIPAQNIEITNNPILGRVISVPVKTRVGSLLSDIHDVEYISLEKGEVVELLGTKMLQTSPDAEPMRWFRIAPPSGEFRWIRASDVTTDPRNDRTAISADTTGADTAEQERSTLETASFDSEANAPQLIEVRPLEQELQPVPDPALADEVVGSGLADGILTRPIVETEASDRDEQQDDFTAARPRNDSGFREVGPPSNPIRNVHALQSNTASPRSSQPAPVATQSHQLGDNPARQHDDTTHVNAVTWQAVPSPTDILTAPEPRSFRSKYNALNVMLSRTVLGDIQDWNLATVREQALLLKQHAQSADHIAATQALLAKITEFEKLKQRNENLLQSDLIATASYSEAPERLPQMMADGPLGGTLASQPTRASSSPLTTNSPAATGPEMPRRVRRATANSDVTTSNLKRNGNELDNSVFDATGVLVLVQSKRSDMPQFALADRSGRISKFVIPAGRRDDLRQFVNQHVGVIGEAGFLRKFNKPLLVASRIVKLEQ